MNKEVRKTRRPNGEGTIYFTKRGDWCAKKWVKENGVKKRISIYARTKIELMRKFILRFGNEKVFGKQEKLSFSFNEHFLSWLLNVKKLEVSSVTLNSNISMFKNHISKYFLNKSIESINNETVLAYFNYLINKKVSKNVFKKCKFLFNQYVSYLLLLEFPIKYPMILNKIKYPKQECENTYKAIPINIYYDYISRLKENKNLRTICYLGLFAGLRIGEIIVLKWENIDFDNKLITINNSLGKSIIFDDVGNVKSSKRILGETKTSCSKRVIPMPQILYDELLLYKEEQIVLCGIQGKKLNFLFSYNDNIKSYTGLKKLLNRFNQKYGYESYNIHFHTFRHTYATRLLEKGTNPKIVQFLLGHRSVKTTMEIYNNIEIYNQSLISLLDKVF